MNRFLVLLAWVSIGGLGDACAQGWQVHLYQKYDAGSFAAYSPAQQAIDPKSPDPVLLNAAVFFATNAQRQAHGLAPFMHAEALERAAGDHSLDMVMRNFFSHQSPTFGRETMKDRLSQVGIRNAYAAENIADAFILNHPAGLPFEVRRDGYYHQGRKLRNRTYSEMGAHIVEQWMNSPGHRRNILSPDTTYLGVGVAFYGDPKRLRVKLTQNFSSSPGRNF